MSNMKSHFFVLIATLVLLGASVLRLADLHRYPPALHYDEAADMLLSRDVAWFGYRPFPVVTAYSGREALFYYVATPLLRIFGTEVMATRLTSAFLGILTVAVTMALGKAMFRHTGIALLAGAWLAVNGAQIWLTRQGFRTSPQPLLEALSLWLLWMALRRDRSWLMLILAGMFGGLTLYVYMAARIFPIWLALPLLILIATDGEWRWLRVRQSFVFLLSLGITALPIGIFYLTNLDVLTDRLTQLAPTAGTPTLMESLWLHLGMFFVQGDPLLRYNLYPGRPFFDPVSGVLMLVGLVISGWWLFTRLPAVDRATMGAVLLSPLLIIPSVIAVNGLPPSHMRSVAMVPLIFFAPALGLVWIGQRWQAVQRYGGSVATVLIVALGVWTWRDYEAWGSRADLFYDSDGDLALASDWLEQHAGEVPTIYIASVYYQHPTVLAHKLDPVRIRWLQADHLFLPPPDQDALLIIPRSIQPPSWMDILDPAWQLHDLPLGPDAQPAFTAYHIPANAQITYDAKFITNFGDTMQLEHFDATPTKAGDKTQVTLIWRVLRETGRDDLAPVVTIMDAWDNEIARAQPYFEYSGAWKPDERLVQRLTIQVPEANPPGAYTVKMTWIGKSKPNDYLPILAPDHSFAGIWLSMRGFLTVNTGEPTTITLDSAAREVLPNLFVTQPPQLPASIGQGMSLVFSVVWYAQTSQPNASILTLSAQPISGGDPITLWSGDPVHNTYPLNQWQANERVIDRYAIRIPPDFPAGDYTIRLTTNGAIQPAFTLPLRIETVERRFDVPALANPLNVRAGDSIWLRGYEVAKVDASHIAVTMAWQANQPPDRDYTGFVHVVSPDGQNFDQIDLSPPRPTSQWIANEVVVATYTLAIPDGAYTLRTGLYLQENGLRLPFIDGNGQSLGDALELTPPS
jgi:4-amino-4-deoxy-L-arabinose transferase-like glycosyltransferase